MGWGRWLLLGDLGQQFDLSDMQSEIDTLRGELRRSSSEGMANAAISGAEGSGAVRRLQQENDELRLYLMALSRLLIAKGAITSEELSEMIRCIDAEDGTADGRYSGPTQV